MIKQTNEGPSFCPQAFVDHLTDISADFTFNDQQDAAECFTQIVDKLSAAEPALGGKFVSRIAYKTVCSVCDYCSIVTDNEVCLMLQPEPSLTECLDMSYGYGGSTELEESVCDKCSSTSTLSIHCSISNPGEILVMQFNRCNNYNGMKYTDFISYPQTLNMAPFTTGTRSNELVYDLIGIIVHNGVHMSCGHYFAVAKHPERSWLKLNDTRVTEISEKAALRQQGAYLCIYQRRKGGFPIGASGDSEPAQSEAYYKPNKLSGGRSVTFNFNQNPLRLDNCSMTPNLSPILKNKLDGIRNTRKVGVIPSVFPAPKNKPKPKRKVVHASKRTMKSCMKKVRTKTCTKTPRKRKAETKTCPRTSRKRKADEENVNPKCAKRRKKSNEPKSCQCTKRKRRTTKACSQRAKSKKRRNRNTNAQYSVDVNGMEIKYDKKNPKFAILVCKKHNIWRMI